MNGGPVARHARTCLGFGLEMSELVQPKWKQFQCEHKPCSKCTGFDGMECRVISYSIAAFSI